MFKNPSNNDISKNTTCLLCGEQSYTSERKLYLFCNACREVFKNTHKKEISIFTLDILFKTFIPQSSLSYTILKTNQLPGIVMSKEKAKLLWRTLEQNNFTHYEFEENIH